MKIGKQLTKANEVYAYYILERLCAAKTKSEIIKDMCKTFRISKSRANDVYNDALKYINSITVTKAEEYKTVLLERLEQQYRESYQIDDVQKRLQRQKELVDSMAKISGVLNNGVSMVNIFEYFPQSDQQSKTIIVNSDGRSIIQENTEQDTLKEYLEGDE